MEIENEDIFKTNKYRQSAMTFGEKILCMSIYDKILPFSFVDRFAKIKYNKIEIKC